MSETVQTAFSLLAQFTGGRGGIDHVIVNYGIGAMFWSILLWVSLSKVREHRQPREGLLIWVFSFGLGRELLMLGMAAAVAFDLTTNEKMHVVFPPLEHALSNIAEIVVAAAFVLFLTKRKTVALLYLKVGIGAIVDAEANSYMGHITTSASRMGVLIDDLLEYSRVGRDDMKFVDVELHTVVTQAVTNIGQDIKDSGAKIPIAIAVGRRS